MGHGQEARRRRRRRLRRRLRCDDERERHEILGDAVRREGGAEADGNATRERLEEGSAHRGVPQRYLNGEAEKARIGNFLERGRCEHRKVGGGSSPEDMLTKPVSRDTL